MIACEHTPNYNQLNLWPLQFLRTGDYYRSYGYTIDRMVIGYWWTSTVSTYAKARHLYSTIGTVLSRNITWQGYGFALRWVA